jgi:predicted DNA binding protein
MIREYVDAGVNPDLRSLGEYDGSEGPLADLTGRQREVLEAAYAAGYYEVPRDASTEDVATELGVDPSTVAEHLQRAERNLLTRHLQAG